MAEIIRRLSMTAREEVTVNIDVQNHNSGMTLVELLVCTVIIGILSTAVLPLSTNFIRYEKETRLKESLYAIRYAIDRYYEKFSIQHPNISENEKYPKTLSDLVNSKLLRKIPIDPFTRTADWVLISSTQAPDSDFYDGTDVFDVRSASDKLAADQTPYSEW